MMVLGVSTRWFAPGGNSVERACRNSLGGASVREWRWIIPRQSRCELVDSMDLIRFTPMTEGNNLVAGRFNFRATHFLNLLPQKFEMLGHSHLLHREVSLLYSLIMRGSSPTA